MNELVASTKLFIPAVRIKQLPNDGVFVKLTIKLFKDEYTLKFKKNEAGGTRICQDFRSEIIVDDSNPIDEAVEWFRIMCLQKSVSIGMLTIETTDSADQIVQKFGDLLRNTEGLLKIKNFRVDGSGAAELMWRFMGHCDLSVLKELRVTTKALDENFELFGKQDAAVKVLEKIEIDCDSIITEEVVSLNASVIFLKSDNSTDDMVYRLIEKFMNKRETGSAFCIQNPKNKNFGALLPPGFSEVEGSFGFYKEYENHLENQPTIYLRVSEDSVRLEVGPNELFRFWTSNGDCSVLPNPFEFDDSDSDYDVYDDFDEVENEFSGSQYDYDPEYDMLDGRGFGSDIDSAEEDYEDDNFD